MKKQVFLCVVFLLQRVADCSIQLQFQFHQYNNPAGLKCNRKCCDVIDVFGYCSSACDTAFTRICLGPGGNSEDCPWSDYMLTPGKVGVNSIQFIDKIGDIDNPFTFTVTSQMGPFQLYVEVVDDDLVLSELIDEVKVQVQGTKGTVTSQTFTGTFGIVCLVLSYSLTCTQNYYGSDCSTYCVPSDNSMGHYNCDPSNGNKICLQGYQKPENDCTEVACSLVCTGGGGSCSESGVCDCSQGWSGVDCGTAQCAENCHPVGGYCNVPGQCLCNDNWNGTNCGQFQCHPNCSTVGGTCVVAGECVCLSDYTGEYCETDLNACAHLSPCKNGGTCSNEGVNQYSCSCPFGFTGMDCEQEIDECNVSPCANGATCIDKIGDYECLCVLGWTGVNCEDAINKCFSQPCQHGGNCTDLVNGYYCSCPVEYEGHDCELLLNACIPDPCQNGGSCNNFTTDYACDCLPGFTGQNCATLLTTTNAMDFTPSTSVISLDTIATPVIAGLVIAILVAVIAVVMALLILAGAVLCKRKKKLKFSLMSQVPLLSGISHFDPASSEHFSVKQQQPQSMADSNHQNHPSVIKMTPNQAYNVHVFGSGDSDDTTMTQNLSYNIFGFDGQQQLLQQLQLQQQLQSMADSNHQNPPSVIKVTPNQAYNVHVFGSGDSDDMTMTQNLSYNIFGFDGQQQLLQDEPSSEQAAVCSARNAVCVQSHLRIPLTSNQAYGVLQQQEHNSMQSTCSETSKL